MKYLGQNFQQTLKFYAFLLFKSLEFKTNFAENERQLIDYGNLDRN